MYGVFPSPPSAGAEDAGAILVFRLAAFGLLLLFNGHRMKIFQKGGGRTRRPKTPWEKAVLVIGGILVGLLLIMVMGMCMERM